MPTAMILPFQRFRPASGKEPFAALDQLAEYSEWQHELSRTGKGREALGIGHALYLESFRRALDGGGPFPDERWTAFALHISPCLYRNRRREFPEFFAFLESQLARSLARLSGARESKIERKNPNFQRKNPNNSNDPPAHILRTVVIEEERSLQGSPSITTDDCSVVALAPVGRATPSTIAQKQPRRPPSSRVLNHFIGCACPICEAAPREPEPPEPPPRASAPPPDFEAARKALKAAALAQAQRWKDALQDAGVHYSDIPEPDPNA